VQSIKATGTICEGGKVGVAVGLTFPQNTGDIVVANNTFFKCDHWLDLRLSSPDVTSVVIANNLILQCQEDAVAAKKYEITEYATHWVFRSNYWEMRAGPLSSDASAVAELLPKIDVLSRDPQHAGDFLRPTSGSDLASAGMGEGLPGYVGAVPP
jgi:hypothetical protein